MATYSPNSPCPCYSGRKYKKCCGRVHWGVPASSPEALMRSRFSAYALGLVDHILRTTHPDGPHWESDPERWRAEVQAFCSSVRFDRLEVLDSGEQGDRGMVDFRAHLSSEVGRTVLAERSLFMREGGRWLYHSGIRQED